MLHVFSYVLCFMCSWVFSFIFYSKCFRKTISAFNFLLDFVFYFLRVFSFIVVQVFSENNFWCQFSTRFWNLFFSSNYSKTVVNAFGKVFLFIFIQAFLENNRFWIFFILFVTTINPFGKWCCDFLICFRPGLGHFSTS